MKKFFRGLGEITWWIIWWLSSIILILIGTALAAMFIVLFLRVCGLLTVPVNIPSSAVWIAAVTIGVCLLIWRIMEHGRQKVLDKYGKVIKAEITAIRSTRLHLRGRNLSMYRIVAIDTDGNSFISDKRFENEVERYMKGDSIKVLVSPKNPRNYRMLVGY